MAAENLFKRLVELLPAEPLLLGTVTARYQDGTVAITFPGGGVQRVRDPLVSALGAPVFVQGSAVQGPAPALPYAEIEV